jgi:hypothetical protein
MVHRIDAPSSAAHLHPIMSYEAGYFWKVNYASHTEYTKLQPRPQKAIKCETYVMDALGKLARKFRQCVYSQKKARAR